MIPNERRVTGYLKPKVQGLFHGYCIREGLSESEVINMMANCFFQQFTDRQRINLVNHYRLSLPKEEPQPPTPPPLVEKSEF